MLTKQQFTKHLTRLIELKKEEEKITNLMRKSKLKDDFNGSLFGISLYEDLSVKILADAMDDKNDWIGYWLYELEYGARYKKGFVTDKDDKEIKMKSISDLYKCLTKK